MKIPNPILPGFFPDPSVCRVGGDYYLVNSSFEYFPGVPIHHSRDLVHWRQIGNCLTRPSQLPLEGAAASDGIYAPTIRYHDGRFYMITTNVRGGGNFFVWTEDPAGPWSEPVWLAQKGIDPSLFFDPDGRVFFTSNGTNWAPVRGVYQCEIDPATGRQLTETQFLWPGTGGSFPEAPHLFRRGDYYYLLVAEGGTAEGHMVTVARSRDPYGPFESCPQNPILTHRSLMAPFQGTGHADFFEDAYGNWWAVFLGFRYGEYGWHHLGRETFLAPVDWTADGWPVVNGGAILQPETEVARPFREHRWPSGPDREVFTPPTLGPAWLHLRNPLPERYSLTDRPGWLRLHGGAETLDDLASPTFVGQRQRHHQCRFATCLDFEPATAGDEAGLTVLASNQHHYEIAVARRDGKRCVVVKRRIGTLAAEVACAEAESGPLEFFVECTPTEYRFGVLRGETAHVLAVGETRYLSTQVAGGYTGVIVGLYTTGGGAPSTNPAEFAWFEIKQPASG